MLAFEVGLGFDFEEREREMSFRKIERERKSERVEKKNCEREQTESGRTSWSWSVHWLTSMTPCAVLIEGEMREEVTSLFLLTRLANMASQMF